MSCDHPIDFAERELGRGEDGGNNAGPDIWRYRRGVRQRGSWCAVFLLWCLEESMHPGLPDACWLTPRAADPFNRFDWRRRRIAGAKLLTRRVGEAGVFVDPGDTLRRGDLVCWHRPRNGVITWRGHVGIVHAYDALNDALVTIEGNRGPYPSRVDWYRYSAGSWRRKLFRVARLTRDA